MQDNSPAVQVYVQSFLARLFPDTPLSLSVEFGSASNQYLVNITTSQPALLIGYHGETLAALQLFCAIHLHHHLAEKVNLTLNVNDYRQRRQSSLESLADSVVAKVVSTRQPHSLPPMTASERRLIHLYLSNHPQVVTSSQGEGRNRGIVIFPKTNP